MEIPEITCARVDDANLDTRYLRGELPDDLAEAFEAHFFACDRCWSLVHGGLAASDAAGAAAATSPAVQAIAPTGTRPFRRRRIVQWAAAAGIAAVLLVVAGKLIQPPRRESGPVLRGGVAPLVATIAASGDSTIVQWDTRPHAATYRITVFSAGGDALQQTELRGTRWALPVDSARRLAAHGRVWLQVEALDSLNQLIATSPLTPLSDEGRGR